jgi:hypothetical protein
MVLMTVLLPPVGLALTEAEAVEYTLVTGGVEEVVSAGVSAG